MEAGGAFEDWAVEAVAHRWPGGRVRNIAALRGDLSTRRFWRISITGKDAPPTAIVVDLGPDDLPRYVHALNLLPSPPKEPPWLNVHRFLESIGAPVPALYAAAPEKRAMMVEDVGELSLRECVRRPGAHVADLFRLATKELLRLHVEGTPALDHRCIASQIAYSGRLFDWEMKEFREIGLAAIAPASDADVISRELSALAAQLDLFPRAFSHRDYHAENLYIQDGPRIRIIDFQDALMAPATQDLAVMMTTRDTDEVVTPAIERRILDFYYSALVRRGAANLSAEDFNLSYNLCVLQHALKMIGRFEMFERAGKSGYARYIPHALGQARRMLAVMRAQFPQLCAALGA